MVLSLALLACASSPPLDAEPVPEPIVEPDPEPGQAEATDDGGVRVGPFTIHPLMHATTRIAFGERQILLDPWSKAPLEGLPVADLVLITDIHGDHLDPEAIAGVRGEGTVVVAPQAVAEQWDGEVDHVLANGESVELDGLSIQAVPMYNLVRGPEEGVLYHDKGRGNGYILSAEGVRVYFGGDTECIDEMRALRDIDLAFVPMNLPYTMPPGEAAECVAAFKPKVVVPYHYRDSDTAEFSSALEGVEGVTVIDLDYYPG